MLYNYIFANEIRIVDSCGNLSFDDNTKHPERTMIYHDLVYVKSGGFNVSAYNESIESREGDIMFLPAHIHHYPNDFNLNNSSCYYIHFSYSDKDNNSVEKFPLNDDYFCIPSKLSIKSNSNIITYFHEITKLCSMDIKENTKLLNSILLRLLSEIELCAYNHNEFEYSRLTNDVMTILLNNINSNISIEDLSEMLNFAPRTIQKHFKSDTGKTIHDYHIQLKLNKSKYLLNAYPNMSIEEIADKLGFYDAFHFSKSFKKLFGLSPNQYKKK